MKIDCPECATHFVVPAAMVGPGGRRVRCPKCGHVWHQMPHQPDSYFDIGVDPIPASVHPVHGDAQEEGPPGFLATLPWGTMGRLAAGFALGWAVILALVYTLTLAGLAPRVLSPLAMGAQHADLQGLEFHDVTARARPDGVALSGRIFNNSTAPKAIPMVRITPVDAKGHKGTPREVRPEADALEPQEGVAFTAQLPGVPADAQLRLRFVPEARAGKPEEKEEK